MRLTKSGNLKEYDVKKSKKQFLKDFKRGVKGITLLALVVTIIVLLILAGVALNLTIGQNGVFQRAQDAANTWRNAETNEQLAMQEGADLIDQYLNGNGGSQDDEQGPIKVSFKIEGEKVTTPPILSGFTHVDGTEINSGYVIQDGDGNQFVWVPVDKNQKIKINVTSESKIDSINLTDPYGADIPLADTDNLGTTYNNENVAPTINGPYILTVTSGKETKKALLSVHSLYATDLFSDWIITEEWAVSHGATLEQLLEQYGVTTVEDAYKVYAQQYKILVDKEDYKQSVNDNGGFYIARYEATYQDGKAASKASTSTRTLSSTTLTNGMLWNYISQTEALSKANEMYASEEFTSSLPTGASWDRTLSWLEETKQVSILELVGDSKTWGNYSVDTFTTGKELINTGTYSETEKNHIYDLAGNLIEWTTESNSSGFPAFRGGCYLGSASYFPAFSRDFDFNPDSGGVRQNRFSSRIVRPVKFHN